MVGHDSACVGCLQAGIWHPASPLCLTVSKVVAVVGVWTLYITILDDDNIPSCMAKVMKRLFRVMTCKLFTVAGAALGDPCQHQVCLRCGRRLIGNWFHVSPHEPEKYGRWRCPCPRDVPLN